MTGLAAASEKIGRRLGISDFRYEESRHGDEMERIVAIAVIAVMAAPYGFAAPACVELNEQPPLMEVPAKDNRRIAATLGGALRRIGVPVAPSCQNTELILSYRVLHYKGESAWGAPEDYPGLTQWAKSLEGLEISLTTDLAALVLGVGGKGYAHVDLRLAIELRKERSGAVLWSDEARPSAAAQGPDPDEALEAARGDLFSSLESKAAGALRQRDSRALLRLAPLSERELSAPPARVTVQVDAFMIDETAGKERLASPDRTREGWVSTWPKDPIYSTWKSSVSWYDGDLCLGLSELTVSVPPNHWIAVGYRVALAGATFGEAKRTGQYVVYRFKGKPTRTYAKACLPIRRT